MKHRCVQSLVVFLPLALAISAFAQNIPPTPGLITFTSPDGSFRFSYPDILIRCELQQSGDAYSWAQPECSSYHPVCNAAPSPDGPVVCLAYPRNEHTRSDTFEAAVFSVGEGNESEKECSGEQKIKDIVIRGVKFKGFASGDGGMSESRSSRAYVAFHNGKCYGLAITVAMADPQAFDPPAKELPKSDWTAINRALEQARDSFQFLH